MFLVVEASIVYTRYYLFITVKAKLKNILNAEGKIDFTLNSDLYLPNSRMNVFLCVYWKKVSSFVKQKLLKYQVLGNVIRFIHP